MQNGKVFTVATLGALLLALLACRLLPRLDTGLRLLPVDRFPRSFAGWTAGPDIPTDPDVQAQLPTAHILERNYTNARGQIANLMLVTATDDEDFHKPTACLPAQGWTLREQTIADMDGLPVRMVDAQREHQGFTIFYYWVKLNLPPPPEHSLLAAALKVRKRIAHEEMSLFVRLTMPDSPQDQPALQQFTREVWNALPPILGGKGEIVLRN
jgi:hypothetical protein